MNFNFFERGQEGRLAKRAGSDMLAHDLSPHEQEIANTVDPDQLVLEGLINAPKTNGVYDPEATVEFDPITREMLNGPRFDDCEGMGI